MVRSFKSRLQVEMELRKVWVGRNVIDNNHSTLGFLVVPILLIACLVLVRKSNFH